MAIVIMGTKVQKKSETYVFFLLFFVSFPR